MLALVVVDLVDLVVAFGLVLQHIVAWTQAGFAESPALVDRTLAVETTGHGLV
jgi:hypothetical protein